MQDVFLAAWRRLDDLRDPAAFGGWIAMIARNRATDFHRRTAEVRRAARQSAGRARRRPPRPRPGAALDAIRALPDAYRETLVLRLVEGLTGPEIADADRPDAGLGAREPASRHEAAAREAGTDDRRRSADDDYLWDGAGEPDAEVVRLETALGPLPSPRHAAGAARTRRARRRLVAIGRCRSSPRPRRWRWSSPRPGYGIAFRNVGLDGAVARGRAGGGGRRASTRIVDGCGVGQVADDRRPSRARIDVGDDRRRGRRAQQPRCG